MTKILPSVITLLALTQTGSVFGPPVPLDVGPGSGEILVADLNRDGNLDIVTKHLMQNRITVSLGDGAGRFNRGDGSLHLPFGPGAVSIGDANADGDPDLLIAGRYGEHEFAGVYPGNGRGGFTKTALVRVHEAMRYYKPSIVQADVNEDGRMDLVTSNGRRNTIQILMGESGGTFGAPVAVSLAAGRDFYTFAVADLNGDRHVDLVAAATMGMGDAAGEIEVALGDGSGQFRRQPALEGLRSPRVEAAADITGDGHLDVIVSHAAPRLTVLMNDGKGRLTHAPGTAIPLGFETHAVVARDLNADGRIDIAAATKDTVTVLLNDGRGFSSASTFRAGPGAFQIAVADLNKDRRPDVLASSFEGNALTLLFGR